MQGEKAALRPRDGGCIRRVRNAFKNEGRLRIRRA
jgi:hypothetical protein